MMMRADFAGRTQLKLGVVGVQLALGGDVARD